MDTVIVLMLLVILSALLWHRQSSDEQRSRIDAVQKALQVIHAQAVYHAAIGDVDAEPNGFPLEINPTWFATPPENALLTGKSAPWLETAEGTSRTLDHPRSIVSETGESAFWYNPHLGIVRARVPMQFTRYQTLTLYNEVNATALTDADIDWHHIEERIVQRDHGAGALVGDDQPSAPRYNPSPLDLPSTDPDSDPARRLKNLLLPTPDAPAS